MKKGYKKQAVTILSCLAVNLKGREYSVSGNLCGIGNEQHGFRSVLLYLCVPLFHVVCEGVEQDFREYPLRATIFIILVLIFFVYSSSIELGKS